jgi:hypothetical protein
MKQFIIALSVVALLPAGSASAGTIVETWNGTGGLTIHMAGRRAMKALEIGESTPGVKRE